LVKLLLELSLFNNLTSIVTLDSKDKIFTMLFQAAVALVLIFCQLNMNGISPQHKTSITLPKFLKAKLYKTLRIHIGNLKKETLDNFVELI